jgi:hypothetical protein
LDASLHFKYALTYSALSSGYLSQSKKQFLAARSENNISSQRSAVSKQPHTATKVEAEEMSEDDWARYASYGLRGCSGSHYQYSQQVLTSMNGTLIKREMASQLENKLARKFVKRLANSSAKAASAMTVKRCRRDATCDVAGLNALLSRYEHAEFVIAVVKAEYLAEGDVHFPLNNENLHALMTSSSNHDEDENGLRKYALICLQMLTDLAADMHEPLFVHWHGAKGVYLPAIQLLYICRTDSTPCSL